MKESYSKDPASHADPESCGTVREGRFEALTGETTGEVLSHETHKIRLPTLLSEAEGNNPEGATANPEGSRRGRRPSVCGDASCIGTGRPRNPARRDGDTQRDVKAARPKTSMFLQHRIGDQRLVRLIGKWLKAGVMESDQWQPSEDGTPQGAVISPLLGNVYLHYALDLWVQHWRKRHARGEVIVVRYADDFVIGCQHQDARNCDIDESCLLPSRAGGSTASCGAVTRTTQSTATYGRWNASAGKSLSVGIAAFVDAATSGDSHGAKCRSTPTAGCHDRRSSTLILKNASMAPPLKVGARCGSSARRDLCGGRGVTRVPTATGRNGRCGEAHPREEVRSEGTPKRVGRGRCPRHAAMRRSFRTRVCFSGWSLRVVTLGWYAMPLEGMGLEPRCSSGSN